MFKKRMGERTILSCLKREWANGPVACKIVSGIPYSSIFNLTEKIHFNKINNYLKRKRMVHCIVNENISLVHKANIIQHLWITDDHVQKFKLYKKSAVDNFLTELKI
jgi:hypothetical protein